MRASERLLRWRESSWQLAPAWWLVCVLAACGSGSAIPYARVLISVTSVTEVATAFLPEMTNSEYHNPVRPCPQDVPQAELNQCIASAIEYFLQSTKNGSEEMGLPPMDPMQVKHLELQQGKGKVSVTLLFNDVRLKGFSTSTVNSVRMNVNDRKLEVSLKAAVYEIDGHYECSGGVYELPLSSSGQFSLTMTDVTSAWMLYFLTKNINNETIVTADRFLLDLSPSNVIYRFDKNFDGENSLGIGVAMDEFMNENALEIYNDVKGKLMRMLSEIFLDVANQVLLHFPKALVLP